MECSNKNRLDLTIEALEAIHKVGKNIVENLQHIERPMRKDWYPFVIWPAWRIESKLFKFYRTHGMWWVKISGIGIKCKDMRVYDLMFSERYGWAGFKIGNYHFKNINYLSL